MYRRLTSLALPALVAALLAAAPAATAQQPSVLRIAFPAEDGSLTPYTFTNGYALMTLVYDTLTWRDARGVARPWLARSIRRGSGGRELIVTLHRGVRWQDGKPLTAADVAFTFDYMKRRYNPRFTPQLAELAGVRASGPRTVVFTLRAPALGFEDEPLADVPILPRHIWKDLPRDRLAPPGPPVGSGPYRLTRHVRGHSYRFEANRDYFRGRPAVDRLDVPIMPASDDSVAGVQAGTLDMVSLTFAPGFDADAMPALAYSQASNYTGTMIEFNLARTPFDRVQVRRAVASALDLGQIAGTSGGPGSRIAARRGFLHPGSRWAGSAILQHSDTQAARIAFAEQGGGTFTVAASVNDPVRLETARLVVVQLRDAGAAARLKPMSDHDLDLALGDSGRRPATFDAAVVGIPALASYDPSFLRAVFGGARGAPLNDGGYRSARFDRLADRVEQAPTVAARRRAVQRELAQLARDAPAVPLFFGATTFLYNPATYDGWVDVRGSGILDKRSFLGAAAAGRNRPAPPSNPADPDGGGQFSLVPVIVVLAVLLLAGLGWSLRRR